MIRYMQGWTLLLISSMLFVGCDDGKMIRNSLDVILDDDLIAVSEGISKDKLLEKPYYKIVEYKAFEDGQFGAKAVVDFYIYRSIKMKIHRKFRFNRSVGKWERYHNVWKHY